MQKNCRSYPTVEYAKILSRWPGLRPVFDWLEIDPELLCVPWPGELMATSTANFTRDGKIKRIRFEAPLLLVLRDLVLHYRVQFILIMFERNNYNTSNIDCYKFHAMMLPVFSLFNQKLFNADSIIHLMQSIIQISLSTSINKIISM